jgi:hypothetical protein
MPLVLMLLDDRGPAAEQAQQQAEEFSKKYSRLRLKLTLRRTTGILVMLISSINLGSRGTSEGWNPLNYRGLSADARFFPIGMAMKELTLHGELQPSQIYSHAC